MVVYQIIDILPLIIKLILIVAQTIIHNYSSNLYCYRNKQFTTYNHQLLDYKNTRNNQIHPQGITNNH